jgi:predicted CopG family antitoxin
MVKTIQVHDETWEKLVIMKVKKKMADLNEVISSLMKGG